MTAHHQHRVRTLWLSGVLHAFTHLYQVALLPLYYLILKDKAFAIHTVEDATFLVTVLMLSYFVPAYPVGVLADRFSKRKLLALGLAINALGFVGLALSRSYPEAIASMILSGFGGSFFHPAATALIARLYPEATGKAFGLLGIGASAGFFFGPIYSGWRAGHAGWRAPVLELGLFGVAAAIVFLFLADEEPPHEPHSTAIVGSGLFPTASLWLLFIASAFAFSLRDFTGSSMGSLGSLFLQNAHGLSTSATGSILATIFVASAISNPLFGGLSDRGVGRWTSLALGIAAVIVFAFPRFPVKAAPIVFPIYGFFFMASYPMVEGALMSSVPHQIRGRVFGVFITIGGILGNVAHWAMGAYVKNLGPASARVESYYSIYAVLSGLLLISLLGLPCLRALRRRETAQGDLVVGMVPEKS
jgi:MFS family permease